MQSFEMFYDELITQPQILSDYNNYIIHAVISP